MQVSFRYPSASVLREVAALVNMGKTCVVVPKKFSAFVVCMVVAMVDIYKGVCRSAGGFLSVCSVHGGGVG